MWAEPGQRSYIFSYRICFHCLSFKYWCSSEIYPGLTSPPILHILIGQSHSFYGFSFHRQDDCSQMCSSCLNPFPALPLPVHPTTNWTSPLRCAQAHQTQTGHVIYHQWLVTPPMSPVPITSFRTSLVVQWLRLHLPIQGVRVWSLVRELRSHMPRGHKKNQNIKQK